MHAAQPFRARDPVVAALLEHGFVHSEYVLDLNDGLHVPYDMALPAPWSLPSRMFRFPIETWEPPPGQPRRLGLLHPRLAGHPFVRRVEGALGIAIERDGAPNEHGYSKAPLALWWHAVDLVTSGHWRDLLATADFTTPGDIMRAVAHGLAYSPHDARKRKQGHLSTSEAREIMAYLGRAPPAEPPAPWQAFDQPRPCKQEKGPDHWPINAVRGLTPEAEAWATIAAVEDGTFAYDRSGYLQWSERGRARHGAARKPATAERSPKRRPMATLPAGPAKPAASASEPDGHAPDPARSPAAPANPEPPARARARQTSAPAGQLDLFR